MVEFVTFALPVAILVIVVVFVITVAHAFSEVPVIFVLLPCQLYANQAKTRPSILTQALVSCLQSIEKLAQYHVGKLCLMLLLRSP